MSRLLQTHNLTIIQCVPFNDGDIELNFRLVIVQGLRMRGSVFHGHYISSQGGAKLSTGKILNLPFESLIITQPTNALIVCHLFLNHFLKHFHCSYMFR